jgi:hypothetical protein
VAVQGAAEDEAKAQEQEAAKAKLSGGENVHSKADRAMA